jgi:hypothetical protein
MRPNLEVSGGLRRSPEVSMRVHILGCVALLLACGCGRKIVEVEEPPRTVVQARVEPCTELCESKFGPCGTGPAPAFDDVAECIEECTTVEGAYARFWAYQSDTREDACFDEFVVQIKCVADVTRRCVDETPWHEDPCREAILAAGVCANPYVREG